MSDALQLELRPATIDDLDIIADFNCRLASETEDITLKPEIIQAGVKRILEDANLGFYTLACVKGEVVGQAMITFEWSDWRNGMIWWYQSVYVSQDFRRQGVFKALSDSIGEQAKNDPDVVGLRLYVEHENERAKSTYRALGIVDSGYEVMERIPL